MQNESQVIVNRFPSESDWTLSKFYILGQEFGVGIEDEFRQVKVHGETRIPNGTYELTLTDSPKFSKSYFESSRVPEIKPKKGGEFIHPHKLITVNNVPNFSRILWHWGNTDEDTDGCYIVGSTIGKIGTQAAVLGSRKKYEQVYPIISSLIKSRAVNGMKTFVTYRDMPQSILA